MLLESQADDRRRGQLLGQDSQGTGTNPLLVRGRVLDNFGLALAGASVIVTDVSGDSPEYRRCSTEADGSFEALADWKAEQLVVHAAHAECWNTVRVPVARGLDGLELRLERFGSLFGVLATRNDDPLPDLSLRLMNEDKQLCADSFWPFRTNSGAVLKSAPGSVSCELDGSFAIRSLPPGRYSLEVRGTDGAGVLARTPEIQVLAGQRCSSAECNPLLLYQPGPVTLALAVPSLPRLDDSFKLYVALWFAPEGTMPMPSVEFRECPIGQSFPRLDVPADADGPLIPSARVWPGSGAKISLPQSGRYQLLWYFDRTDTAKGLRLFGPVNSARCQYVEIVPWATELQLDLDEAQLKQLSPP